MQGLRISQVIENSVPATHQLELSDGDKKMLARLQEDDIPIKHKMELKSLLEYGFKFELESLCECGDFTKSITNLILMKKWI